MLQEAAEGGAEALGFTPSTAWPHHGDGQLSRPGNNISAAPPGGGEVVTDEVDEDRDVRELESMLLDLEAEEEGFDNAPIADLTPEECAELAAAAATDALDGGPANRLGESSPVDGAAAAAAQSSGQGTESEARTSETAAAAAAAAGSGSQHAPLAFTIEEDDGQDEGARAASDSGTSPSSRPAPPSAGDDFESTRALIGSIADSLAPLAAPGGGDADADGGEGGGLLAATPSELALVSLMEEAEEEPGGLLPAPDNGNSGTHRGIAGEGNAAAHGSPGVAESGCGFAERRRLGSFDDALSAGSMAVGSLSEKAGATTKGGSVNNGNSPLAPDSGGASSLTFGGTTRVPTTESSASGSSQADSAGPPTAVAEEAAPFSLGHRRWVTCGFTSAHTVGRGGQEAESVGRALRDSSSVLALDNMNYFLAR